MRYNIQKNSSILILIIVLFLNALNCDQSSGIVSENSNPIAESIRENLVKIIGGEYNFSSISQNGEMSSKEGILKDFYLSKFELTQREWREVMGTNPPNLNNVGMDNHPVEMVTWNEVNDFISKLNKISGSNYRLPKSTEWEYAARGGQKSQNYKYSGSNDPAHDAVWHGGSIPEENIQNKKYTMEVGTKKPNELGLYDMSGNVREWLDDCVGAAQKGTTFFLEGTKFIVTDSCDVRISKGGGATDWIYECDVTLKKDHLIIYRSPILGFRLAHDIE